MYFFFHNYIEDTSWKAFQVAPNIIHLKIKMNKIEMGGVSFVVSHGENFSICYSLASWSQRPPLRGFSSNWQYVTGSSSNKLESLEEMGDS